MSWFSKFKPQYVGKVHAYSIMVDEDGKPTPGGKSSSFYVLSEGFFGRDFKKVGYGGTSEFASRVKAEVIAWQKGGPLPEGTERELDEIKKPKLVIKEGKVLSFPKDVKS